MYIRYCSLAKNRSHGSTLRFFSKSSDIVSSPPNLEWLYRAEESKKFFTISTFLLGRFADMHYKQLEAKYIVDHQKSSRLISTTSNKQVAYTLADRWQREVILEIDPAYIRNHLVDTNNTLRSFGTDFYTKMNEYEHTAALIPMCAIKSIDLIKQGIKITNPLFIKPTPVVIREFSSLYEANLQFLELLFNENTKLSSEERQHALNLLIDMYSTFYEKTIPSNNPFNMTVNQFRQYFTNSFGKVVDVLASYDPDMTINELMHKDGDRLLMSIAEYRILLTAKKRFDYYEEDRNYYGRSSYQYE